MKDKYTQLQGQYLAFIHYYTKIHGRAPAETDMQKYFKVSPPTVHQIVLTLEKKGTDQKSTPSGTVNITVVTTGRAAGFGVTETSLITLL